MSELGEACRRDLLDVVPNRSPVAVADFLMPFFRDRLACDLGCGVGDFMAMMRERGARAVVGVERHADLASRARDRGFFVQLGDLRECVLPPVGFYYSWLPYRFCHDRLLRRLRAVAEPGALWVARVDRHEGRKSVYNWNPTTPHFQASIDFDEGDGRRQRGTVLLYLFSLGTLIENHGEDPAT